MYHPWRGHVSRVTVGTDLLSHKTQAEGRKLFGADDRWSDRIEGIAKFIEKTSGSPESVSLLAAFSSLLASVISFSGKSLFWEEGEGVSKRDRRHIGGETD